MNAVERCVILSRGEYITELDLPLSLRQGDDQISMTTEAEQAITPVDLPLEEVEKAAILRTLESTKGNKSEAARKLGITRRTLHKKLKKYGVM
jgi:two-component system response regulator HydG